MNNSPDIDRGWAFAILFGHFFVRFLATGLSMSPGILYDQMLHYFESSPVLTAWAINLNSFFLYLSGNVSSSIVKAYGSRVAMIIGCLLSTVGLFVTSFGSNIIYVLAFYGIITGFGFSMVYVACYPVITEYFVEHRSLALLLTSSGEGVGQFILPYLFLWLSNIYSWQGALIVIAGLNLNFLVVAASFMPPRIESEEKEEEQTLELSDSLQFSSLIVSLPKTRGTVSCMKTSFVCNLTLFRDYCFILVCFSYLFNAIGYAGVMTHIKVFGLQKGLTDVEATTLLSFVGLFNLVGTVTIVLILRSPPVNVLVLNLIFTIGIGVSVIILVVVKVKKGFFIMVAIMGFFCGSIACFPVVILTVVGVHNIAAGIGYVCISLGIGGVAGGPIGAALHTADVTYVATFVTFGISIIFGALLQAPIIFKK